jgi:hypothetical protein
VIRGAEPPMTGGTPSIPAFLPPIAGGPPLEESKGGGPPPCSLIILIATSGGAGTNGPSGLHR